MDSAVEVTRGAGGCDPQVEDGTWVLWRGSFGVEKVVGKGQDSQLGAKKLQGNLSEVLSLMKSPDDRNMKPDPACRVLAHGGAAMCGHVSRGPHFLQRRCPVCQA